MQNSCWTVNEYIFAQVASSFLWFCCTAIGGLIFYKLRHKIAGVMREVLLKTTNPYPSVPTVPESPSGTEETIVPPPVNLGTVKTCEACGGPIFPHQFMKSV